MLSYFPSGRAILGFHHGLPWCVQYVALGRPVATKPSGYTVGFCGDLVPCISHTSYIYIYIYIYNCSNSHVFMWCNINCLLRTLPHVLFVQFMSTQNAWLQQIGNGKHYQCYSSIYRLQHCKYYNITRTIHVLMIISKVMGELITQNLTEPLLIPYNSREWFRVEGILVDPPWRYRLDCLPARMLPSSDYVHAS